MPHAAPPGYIPYTPQGTEWRYAGWWARVGAALVDGLFAGALVLPGNIVSAAGPKQLRPCTSNPAFTCSVPTDATAVLSTTLIIIGLIVWTVLYARWVASGHGSLGQRATHIRIVDANTGAPVGAWRAIGRRLAWVLSYFICFLGFFWMLWDRRKQTFHDKIASTVVIRQN